MKIKKDVIEKKKVGRPKREENKAPVSKKWPKAEKVVRVPCPACGEYDEWPEGMVFLKCNKCGSRFEFRGE